MKRILVSLLLIATCATGWAQTKEYRRPGYLGFSFFLNDYNTPARIRATSLSAVLTNNEVSKFRDMAPGMAISYFRGISNHLDLAVSLSNSFVTIRTPENTSGGDKYLGELDASANLKLLSERYKFTPYLIAGLGVSQYDGKFDAIMPLGYGLKYNLAEETSIFINTQYRVPVTRDRNEHHLMFSLGFAGMVGKPRVVEVKEVIIPQAPKDTDGDGIMDDADKCVDVPGVAKYNGCPVPDTDGDGINDEADKCPTVRGVAKYEGCPVPDTDLDGINDEEDKCPAVYGVAKYDGCPVPDTDGDGINDEKDKCPTLAGVAENDGCPAIKEEIIKRLEYAAQHIYFATGSAKLLSTSFKSLNDVVKILNDDQNLKLSIEGHTDNVGKDDYNHTLSHNRAMSVMNYLKSKGVDESRLSAQGFGETRPVADNKTAAGRQKNRRVVMTVAY